MVQITVRYFAMLREQRGVESEVIEVPPGLSLREIYHRIFPPGVHEPIPVAFVRNRAAAPPDTEVEVGDEVAFLPPLGGG